MNSVVCCEFQDFLCMFVLDMMKMMILHFFLSDFN